MSDWSFPGLAESARARLEGAGFTPESVARARPSEVVRRAGLRADLARLLIAHYRGEDGGSDSNGEETAPPSTAPPLRDGDGPARVHPMREEEGDGAGREWERVWDLGGRSPPSGAPWRWKGRVVLRVSLLRPP